MAVAKKSPALNPRAELAELAARREQLIEKRDTIAAAPRPLAEAEPDLDALIAAAPPRSPSAWPGSPKAPASGAKCCTI